MKLGKKAKKVALTGLAGAALIIGGNYVQNQITGQKKSVFDRFEDFSDSLTTPTSDFISNVSEENTSLEPKLEQIVKSHRKKENILSGSNHGGRREETSITVFDLTTNSYIATINSDVPRQLASKEKYMSAIATMGEVQNGNLVYGPIMDSLFRESIHRSKNKSANAIRDFAGGPSAVTNYFEQKGIDININSIIPHGGAEYKNKATGRSEIEILYGLHHKKFYGSDKVLKHMRKSDRGDHNRLLKYTHIPAGCRFWNKTGSTGRSISDSAIISPMINGERRPYIISVNVDLRDRDEKNNWLASQRRLRSVFRDISNATYDFMEKRYSK